MKAPAGAQRGFTLLEMLVATSMVAVLAGSLYASLYVAFKARRSALGALGPVRKAGLSMDLIRRDLLCAAVPGDILAGPFVGQSGQGLLDSGGDELTFYASAADGQAGPGESDIRKIEYSCEFQADSGDLQLVRRVTANLLAPVTQEPVQEIICRGLKAFYLRYFDGAVWQDNWDSTTQDNVLPMAVEVTIEPADGGADGARPIRQVIMIPCCQDSSAAASAGESP